MGFHSHRLIETVFVTRIELSKESLGCSVFNVCCYIVMGDLIYCSCFIYPYVGSCIGLSLM